MLLMVALEMGCHPQGPFFSLALLGLCDFCSNSRFLQASSQDSGFGLSQVEMKRFCRQMARFASFYGMGIIPGKSVKSMQSFQVLNVITSSSLYVYFYVIC